VLDLGSHGFKSWRYVCLLSQSQYQIDSSYSYMCYNFANKSGHMLDNVSAKTIAGRELEGMTSSSKATLVAKLDKTLNANVNKVNFSTTFRLFSFKCICLLPSIH
jgi:hypothetical protein